MNTDKQFLKTGCANLKAALVKPMFWEQLMAAGYERLDFQHPDTYATANTRYRTYRKDGVRIALDRQRSLGVHHSTVMIYDTHDEADLIIQALVVDPGKRRQGKATAALKELAEFADYTGTTIYLEPIPLGEGRKISFDKLTALYRRFGFVGTDTSNRVMVRAPRTE